MTTEVARKMLLWWEKTFIKPVYKIRPLFRVDLVKEGLIVTTFDGVTWTSRYYDLDDGAGVGASVTGTGGQSVASEFKWTIRDVLHKVSYFRPIKDIHSVLAQAPKTVAGFRVVYNYSESNWVATAKPIGDLRRTSFLVMIRRNEERSAKEDFESFHQYVTKIAEQEEIICYSCRYYSGNPHLRCAVYPIGEVDTCPSKPQEV